MSNKKNPRAHKNIISNILSSLDKLESVEKSQHHVGDSPPANENPSAFLNSLAPQALEEIQAQVTKKLSTPKEMQSRNTRQQFNSHIQLRGLKVRDSRIYDYINDENIVELYDLDKVQLFANFRFDEVCKYHPAILTRQSYEKLFQRSDDDTLFIAARWEKAILNSEGLFFDVPAHNLKIRYPDKVDQVRYVPLAYCTVVDSYDKAKGLVACSDCEIVRSLSILM